ncbi:MAG: hypothetical protein P4L93_02635 [Coriobacteriia bacterium]|nr:hypothetical protein [Coriobacteriia bacterium]
MKRRHRRLLWGVGTAAAVLVALAGVAWWFRVPLLELIPTPPVVITDTAQGSVVHLLQGQHLEVRLRGNMHSDTTWHVGIPLTFLPQSGDSTFTRDPAAAKEGDGYQSLYFTATGKGFGPLFLDELPNNDQNSYQPSRSFSVIIAVQ